MVDNINVGTRLGGTGASIGLGIRISGCGRRRHLSLIASRTGGTLGQEWFDEVLVVSYIGPRRASGVGRGRVPLELLLVCSLVDRIGARVASDLTVLMARKEACNDYTDYCSERKATNT